MSYMNKMNFKIRPRTEISLPQAVHESTALMTSERCAFIRTQDPMLMLANNSLDR